MIEADVSIAQTELKIGVGEGAIVQTIKKQNSTSALFIIIIKFLWWCRVE